MKTYIFGVGLLALAACDTASTGDPVASATGSERITRANAAASVRVTPSNATAAFQQVVRSVEPVAERECNSRSSGLNCDFRILVDDRPNQPANAFQTLDKNGRPIIVFTRALLNDASNSDELAFVLGHEAAHHVANHIARQRSSAATGMILAAGLATLAGASSGTVDSVSQLGGTVGARTYSKKFELEADALGTVISYKAGYDPLRGAEFFARIPDPGDRFLGTHPPNGDRIATVRATMARLR